MEAIIVSVTFTFLLYGGLLLLARLKRKESEEGQRRRYVRNIGRGSENRKANSGEEGSKSSAWKRFLREVSKG
jgi:hypothetical protein